MNRPAPSASLRPVSSKRERQESFRARMPGARPEQVVQAASLFQGVKPEEMKVRRWPSL